MVGHDDGGLADHAEAPQLGHAHDHLGGFPGADLVEQPGRGLVDHPGDGGDLVRAGPERQRQAGQRQVGVVVAAQHQVVEPLVVGGGQAGGAGRVLPRPFGEPLAELGGFLLGGEGGVQVEDAAFRPSEVVGRCRGPRSGAARGWPGPARGRGSGSVPQVEVASTLYGLPRTAQIWPPGCSTCSRGSSRVSRRNCRT